QEREGAVRQRRCETPIRAHRPLEPDLQFSEKSSASGGACAPGGELLIQDNCVPLAEYFVIGIGKFSGRSCANTETCARRIQRINPTLRDQALSCRVCIGLVDTRDLSRQFQWESVRAADRDGLPKPPF